MKLPLVGHHKHKIEKEEWKKKSEERVERRTLARLYSMNSYLRLYICRRMHPSRSLY